jgi:hypothetical protein
VALSEPTRHQIGEVMRGAIVLEPAAGEFEVGIRKGNASRTSILWRLVGDGDSLMDVAMCAVPGGEPARTPLPPAQHPPLVRGKTSR